LSELLVTKVLEVMASAVFLMTPAIPGSGERNMDMLTHASEVVFYQPTNLPFVVQTIREFLARPEMMDRIAMTGMHKVRTEHSLELRLKQLFSTMFKAEPFELPTVGVPQIQ